MSGIRKSNDFGLTNAERKSLRETEAQEAMSDHNDAEKAFHDNRERLRTARLAREAVAGPVLYPALGLPDETPIVNVRFSTRVSNALTAAGVKTVGDIREASDATLLSFHDPWSRLDRPPSRNFGSGAIKPLIGQKSNSLPGGNDFRLLRCPPEVLGDRNASAAKPYSTFDRKKHLAADEPYTRAAHRKTAPLGPAHRREHAGEGLDRPPIG